MVYIPGMENVATFHTYGRIDQETVVKLPDTLSSEIAAGLPVVYATVLYGLRDVGRLGKGEKILIHAAAGGVGQAAIRYAKHVGAEIFATVSSLEKRQLLTDSFHIPESHIFSSRDLTFAKGILRMTHGKGVDMILNSLSGEALRTSWELLAPFGRFIEIGKKDAQLAGRLDLRPFLQNVTLASVDLITMMKYKPALIKSLIEDTVRLWSEGVVQAAEPTKVMPMSQALEAFQTLQTGRGMGKMVLVPGPEDVVPIVPAKPKEYRFRADATYVLAGGLGGIGRSAAKWMAERGARSFLFLSSSGRVTDAVAQMRAELEKEGCVVVIRKCDVSDKAALEAVLGECKRTLPPIRGVIQGAMKLSVSSPSPQALEILSLTRQRIACSRICPTKRSSLPPNPRFKAHGTCTPSFRKTSTTSSCSPPRPASSATEVRRTTPQATPSKTRSRNTAVPLAWQHQPSTSGPCSRWVTWRRTWSAWPWRSI